MDINSPTVNLCIEGTRAEFTGRTLAAKDLYKQAWEAAVDDYDKCVAAHYVARFQATPEEELQWNQLALAHAEKVNDERVASFYPSLYVNLGRSYEQAGSEAKALHYYALAAELGLVHQPEGK